MSLSETIGTEFLGTDGKTKIGLADFGECELVAIYFSAHWCGPCRGFTPKLAKFYNELKEAGVNLPIIFGSRDKDEESFQEYFSEMPWFAFPHDDERVSTLDKKYKVSGIPWLVVIDAKTGKLIKNEADEDLGNLQAKATDVYNDWLALRS